MPTHSQMCASCDTPTTEPLVATKRHGKIRLCESCRIHCERKGWLDVEAA